MLNPIARPSNYQELLRYILEALRIFISNDHWDRALDEQLPDTMVWDHSLTTLRAVLMEFRFFVKAPESVDVNGFMLSLMVVSMTLG